MEESFCNTGFLTIFNFFITFAIRLKNYIMIPKAYVHQNQTFVISPTEEQLITHFSQYGLTTIKEILDEYFNN